MIMEGKESSLLQLLERQSGCLLSVCTFECVSVVTKGREIEKMAGAKQNKTTNIVSLNLVMGCSGLFSLF